LKIWKTLKGKSGLLQRFLYRFNFCNLSNVVTLINVMRKDGSSLAPAAQTGLDQSATAIQSSFLFNQGAYF
jgi:hypothetical protein